MLYKIGVKVLNAFFFSIFANIIINFFSLQYCFLREHDRLCAGRYFSLAACVEPYAGEKFTMVVKMILLAWHTKIYSCHEGIST